MPESPRAQLLNSATIRPAFIPPSEKFCTHLATSIFRTNLI
jgi:hypothetical protein